jgi:hypothetical protein
MRGIGDIRLDGIAVLGLLRCVGGLRADGGVLRIIDGDVTSRIVASVRGRPGVVPVAARIRCASNATPARCGRADDDEGGRPQQPHTLMMPAFRERRKPMSPGNRCHHCVLPTPSFLHALSNPPSQALLSSAVPFTRSMVVPIPAMRDEGNAKAFVMSKEGSERGQNEEGSEASPKNSSIQAILRSQCNSVDDREPTPVAASWCASATSCAVRAAVG